MKKTLKILVLAIIIATFCTITNVFAAEETTKTLTNISVTTEPKKKEYAENEKFNPEGMVITATYSDNTKKQVTGYTYYPNGSLSVNNSEIEISYTEGGVTKKTSQKVTVKTALTGLKLNYKDITLALNSLQTWGLVVSANPNGATIPELVWSSSDPKIVTVTPGETGGNATLKPVSVGKATITVKTTDGKYSATCNVIVSDGTLENVNTNQTQVKNTTTTKNTTTNTNSKATTNTAKNTSTDNTAKKISALPKAGLQSCIAIIFIIAIVALVSYKKYNNYKDI